VPFANPQISDMPRIPFCTKHSHPLWSASTIPPVSVSTSSLGPTDVSRITLSWTSPMATYAFSLSKHFNNNPSMVLRYNSFLIITYFEDCLRIFLSLVSPGLCKCLLMGSLQSLLTPSHLTTVPLSPAISLSYFS
jgi:hypothetical protein